MTRFSLPLRVSLAMVLSALSGAAAPPVAGPEVLSDAAAEAELSLGVRAEASESRTEVAGFLALSVPLERLGAPRRAAAAEAPPAAAPPASVEVPPTAVPTEPEPRAVSRLLHPAALSALARGALVAARRAENAPERERALDGLASRARLSSLLPEVRFRAARTRDESLRLTPTTDDPYRFTLAGGDAVVLEGAATFRLSRLLFADEELAVERLRLERERSGERRVARVLERVLAWHGALVRLSSATDEAESARWSLELDAAAVELDVLTNGWFGTRVEELGVLPSRVELPRPSSPEERPPRQIPTPAGETGGTTPTSRRSLLNPPEPCLPMHETGLRTFRGVSMR